MDFVVKTDHRIQARRPDILLNNKEKKRTSRLEDFAVSSDREMKRKDR